MDKRKRTIARKLFGLPGPGIHESAEDRQMIAAALALSSDPRIKRLARDCLSPSYRGTSFAGICDQMQIEYRDVERELRAISKSQGFIRISQHLPDLMEQSAVDARSRYEPCRKCDETGVIFEGKDEKVCPSCHGEKQVYMPGEVDRLKLVFETMGLIGKGGGVNVNLDLRKVDEAENVEDLYGSVSGILEGKVE
jgi:hypothetical protein